MLPTITGTCDGNYFYIHVEYGSQGNNFQTIVGPRQLSPEMAEGYNFQENGTNFSLKVPHDAVDSAFEVHQQSANSRREWYAWGNCSLSHSW